MVEAGIPKKSASNAMILYERFGLNQFFSRLDVSKVLTITPSSASELLRKLHSTGIIESVNGMGKE